ncbi:conserved hypothetical protein, partial [Ricinus communis]
NYRPGLLTLRLKLNNFKRSATIRPALKPSPWSGRVCRIESFTYDITQRG